MKNENVGQGTISSNQEGVINKTSEHSTQDTQQKSRFGKNKALLVFVVISGFIISGSFGYYLGLHQSGRLDSLGNTVLTPTPTSTTTKPSPTPSHYPKSPDSKLYENSELGYIIEYSKNVGIYECPDIPCASIGQYTLRIEPLRFYKFTGSYTEAIESDDLYCSADGPTGSVYCLNPEVKSFTNTYKVDGFKVLRTKVIETYNPTTQARDSHEYDDRAYVFPVTHSEYKAVLFAVDSPSLENLKYLDTIVETFRVTN